MSSISFGDNGTQYRVRLYPPLLGSTTKKALLKCRSQQYPALFLQSPLHSCSSAREAFWVLPPPGNSLSQGPITDPAKGHKLEAISTHSFCNRCCVGVESNQHSTNPHNYAALAPSGSSLQRQVQCGSCSCKGIMVL